jgi:hypothetical protein
VAWLVSEDDGEQHAWRSVRNEYLIEAPASLTCGKPQA